jgi:NAD(P)H dehydrogenase (quinone)
MEGGYGSIEDILMPVQRLTLGDMGFTVTEPFIAYGVPRSDEDERRAMLQAFASAAVDFAALPVERNDDYLTALDEVPEGAWARKA